MFKMLLTTSAIALAMAMPLALSAQETSPQDDTAPLEAAPDSEQPIVDEAPAPDGSGDAAPEMSESSGDTLDQDTEMNPAAGSDPTISEDGEAPELNGDTLGQDDEMDPAAGSEPVSSEESGAPASSGDTLSQDSEMDPAAGSEPVISEEDEGALRADKVIGMKVLDSQGEEVGKVKDIILDEEGKMSGLVVSMGGFLGIGAKEVGISTEETSIDVENETVVSSLSQEELEQAPEFKTQEDIEAEQRAEQQQREMEQQQQQQQAPTTDTY